MLYKATKEDCEKLSYVYYRPEVKLQEIKRLWNEVKHLDFTTKPPT